MRWLSRAGVASSIGPTRTPELEGRRLILQWPRALGLVQRGWCSGDRRRLWLLITLSVAQPRALQVNRGLNAALPVGIHT